MTKQHHDTFSTLARRYNVGKYVFMCWIRPIREEIRDAGNGHGGRVLTPAQRSLILSRIGRPTGRKPLSISGMAGRYGMSKTAFFEWVEPFKAELATIGNNHTSPSLTPLQERFLKQKLEPPKRKAS